MKVLRDDAMPPDTAPTVSDLFDVLGFADRDSAEFEIALLVEHGLLSRTEAEELAVELDRRFPRTEAA
jgi:hypothetical protein